ncbi:hypothetical protein [Paraburkholderia sp. JHI869]|uniref:hypothetical protein n=1 Tax=Paraburkholderia sp. JHI869 TaxID=3112959 RepID=UPI003181ADA2
MHHMRNVISPIRRTLNAARAISPQKRALLRVCALILLISPILTSAFAFFAFSNHPDFALGLTAFFCFMCCTLLAVWIRSDARHAWSRARESGFVPPGAIRPGRAVRVASACPSRWLVVLHVELHGGIVAARALR